MDVHEQVEAVRWEVRLLGGLEVRRGGDAVARYRSRKAAMLLACLAYDPGRAYNRDTLVELFWPPDGARTPQAGQNSLRVALSWLRTLMEPPGTPAGTVLLASRASVRLNPDLVASDVADLDAGLRAAAGADGPAARAALLAEALARYRGPLLPESYDDWVVDRREGLSRRYTAGLLELAELLRAQGDAAGAEDSLRRAIEAEPLGEEAHRALLRLALTQGREEYARRHYERLADVLWREEEREPAPETQALAREAGIALARARSVGGRAPRAARRHRLRSASRSAAPAEPQAGPAQPGLLARPGRLPALLTRFFGREEELRRLGELLADPACRLITLLGTGGCGKTRLAAEAGRRRVESAGIAAWFVPLADVQADAGVPAAVARALGVCPAPGEGPWDAAGAALAAAPSLLVLDNAEHVLAGAAGAAASLLDAAPRLTCLVTSRQPLAIEGERVVAVRPLPFPDPASDLETVLASPCVRLFVDRAQHASHEFRLTARSAPRVAELCARLDGLPLSIELAAAWAHSATPGQMLERLDRRFDLLVGWKRRRQARHQSVRAALDWSFEGLDGDLQEMLACLSVFRGGWSAEACAAVCGRSDALPGLAELQSRSLLTSSETRFGIRHDMLETVREYASERLTPPAREDACGRHARYFMGLAGEASEHIGGSAQAEWAARLEADHQNLAAALGWLERVDRERFGRMAVGLRGYWYLRGLYREGLDWLQRAAGADERGGTAVAPEVRAPALNAAGAMASALGEYPLARALLEEGADVRRALGDVRGAAAAANNLAMLAIDTGDRQEGLRRYGESLALFRAAGDGAGAATALGNLAAVRIEEGALAEAEALLQECLALRREQEDAWSTAIVLNNLAEVAHRRGDDAAAFPLAREALELFRRLEADSQAAACLETLAAVSHGLGRPEQAAVLFGAADAARQAVGAPQGHFDVAQHQAELAGVRSALGEAVFAAAWLAGTQMGLAQAAAYTLGLLPPGA